MKSWVMAIMVGGALAATVAGPRDFAVPGAAAQESEVSKRVDDYVNGEMRAEKIPGVALGVARDGQNVKARGYGLANVKLDAPEGGNAISDGICGEAIYFRGGDDAGGGRQSWA